MYVGYSFASYHTIHLCIKKWTIKRHNQKETFFNNFIFKYIIKWTKTFTKYSNILNFIYDIDFYLFCHLFLFYVCEIFLIAWLNLKVKPTHWSISLSFYCLLLSPNTSHLHPSKIPHFFLNWFFHYFFFPSFSSLLFTHIPLS